jgi:hypothetical protein
MPKSILRAVSVLAAFSLGFGCIVHFGGARWHTFYCTTVLPATRWSPHVERFRDCSSVKQTLLRDSFENVAEGPQSDYPGWTVLTCADKSRQARFRVKVERDRSAVTIFPRVSGSASGVELFDLHESTRRKLFGVQGRDNVWSGVASQYEINLGCVDEGDKPDISVVELEFILQGPWAQVWSKDGTIFY